MPIEIETTAKALMDAAPVDFNPEQAQYVARLMQKLEATKDVEIEELNQKLADARLVSETKSREADRLFDKLIDARTEHSIVTREYETLKKKKVSPTPPRSGRRGPTIGDGN